MEVWGYHSLESFKRELDEHRFQTPETWQPAGGRLNILSLVHPLVIEDHIERCPGISGMGPFNPITSICHLHGPGRNRNGTVYTLWYLHWFPTALWFLMTGYFTVSGWTNCCAVGGEDPPPLAFLCPLILVLVTMLFGNFILFTFVCFPN